MLKKSKKIWQIKKNLINYFNEDFVNCELKKNCDKIFLHC